MTAAGSEMAIVQTAGRGSTEVQAFSDDATRTSVTRTFAAIPGDPVVGGGPEDINS